MTCVPNKISVRRETLNTAGVKCVSDRDFLDRCGTLDTESVTCLGQGSTDRCETLETGRVKCVSDNECCIDVKRWTLDV